MGDCLAEQCNGDMDGWRPKHQSISFIDKIKDALPKEDVISHPKHYTSHPSGVECIQITEHMGFNLGCALKYIWRCDLKRDAIEDLRKAVWYIEREINKRMGESNE